ncbi:unnamed protein product [Rotaria sp. Silwood1]|nr:unnamed protein product [Rotaria sp. Silwood1]
MFNRRFRGFMKNIILSKCAALGEVTDYFYQVEFQKRGSAHIHMIAWIKNAPKYGENSDDEVIQFIDKYITCQMPNERKDPFLHEIITKVQTHSKSHSKSCKRRDKVCRFNFPKPISRRTFIVDRKFKEVNNNDNNDEDDELNRMKTKIKEINVYLKEIEDKNIILNWNHFDDSLAKVEWTYDDYERALKILLPIDTVILKRAPEDRWVNNYNEKCIINWNANMDVQFVMNAYACGKYMLSYICKAEKEMSDILRNVHEEAKNKNMSIQQEMKALSGVYFHNREVCVQEAMYRVCSLPLKNASRKDEFVPTDPDCFRLSKPLSLITKMITEGKEDNEGLLYSNFVDKYFDRPDGTLFDICLADFVAQFGFINKNAVRKRTQTWPLKTLNFAVYKRKREIVIRYPRFELYDDEERYYHNLMRLFLPIRKEDDIKEPYSYFFHNGYITSICGEVKSVKLIVLLNRDRYETKISKQLEAAMHDLSENNIQTDVWGTLCAETELEQEEIAVSIKNKYNKLVDLDNDENPDIEYMLKSKRRTNNLDKNIYEIHSTTFDSTTIRPMLNTMTHEQLNIFYYLRDWCLRKIANENTESIRLFITGGAGTGKSHLLKCMFYEAKKILNKMNHGQSNDIRTLICAPTNAAALNMNCSTIHCTFKVGLKNFNLSENVLNSMRSKLDGLCLLFIDEISLVDRSLWRDLHTQLGQIMYKTGANTFFGNVSIIAVGDFYQLPPVKGVPLYLSNNVVDYWQNLFEYYELTICQRTKEAEFYALANRIRKKRKDQSLSEEDKRMLKRCVDRYNLKLYQDDCLHLFAWNQFVDEHNKKMLSLKCKEIVDVPGEQLTINKRILDQKKKRKLNTYDYKNLKLAVGARVIIEENVSRDDEIVKGAFGNIVEIVFNISKKNFINHIRVKFDNPDCGRQHQNICAICRKEKTICIQRYNNARDDDEYKKNTAQFPIRLGWASTVHKVQGATIKGVVVDLKRFNQPGQGYVSFTRPTNSDELFLTELREEAFFCDEQIEESIIKMRKMLYQYAPIDKKAFFRLGFHNVEGLEAHYNDIKNHHWYKTCNIICINETWLQSTNCQCHLEGFSLLVKNRSDSYHNPSLCERNRGGVGFFIRNDTNFEVVNLPCCNVESLTIKSQILKKLCFLTTVYKPPNINSTTFISNFHQQLLLLNLQNDQHIIMGDFNENANNIDIPIHKYFEARCYNRLVFENTTLGNTLLDCVFIKDVNTKQKLSIIPAYFSYHNALTLELFEHNINLEETEINNNTKNISSNNLLCHVTSEYSSKRKKINNQNCQLKRKKTTEGSIIKRDNKKKKILDEKVPDKRNEKQLYMQCSGNIFLKHLHYSREDNISGWYSFEDIENLLKKAFKIYENNLLSTNRYVYIFTPILGTNIIRIDGDEHNELLDQIYAFQRQRLVDVLYATINEIIIPINLHGSHWVILFIVFPLLINDHYYVFYFDSLGQQIPASIVNTLIKSNIITSESPIHSNFQEVLQTDERNCGPWIITCATKWLATKEINILHLSLINIELERKNQEFYLQNLYSNRAVAN